MYEASFRVGERLERAAGTAVQDLKQFQSVWNNCLGVFSPKHLTYRLGFIALIFSRYDTIHLSGHFLANLQ